MKPRVRKDGRYWRVDSVLAPPSLHATWVEAMSVALYYAAYLDVYRRAGQLWTVGRWP